MSRVYRKQKQQYVLAGLVGLALLLSIGFFLFFFLPARSQYVALESELDRLQGEIRQRQEVLERLEFVESRLDDASSQFLYYFGGSLIPRSVGFAALLLDLERMSQAAGIERGLVNYTVAEQPEYGVYPVTITIPLRGDYSAVRRFIQELELSDTFFILDSMGMARSDTEGGDALDVSLSLTSFFAHER